MSVRPHPYKGKGWWEIDCYPNGRNGKRLKQPYNGTKEEAIALEGKLKLSGGTPGKVRRLFEKEELSRQGEFIYFIRQGYVGAIKIGYTKRSLIVRMNAIQTCNPYPLFLLGYIYNATPELEARLHCKFSPYRVRGEWFTPSKELKDFIYSLLGSSDYDKLDMAKIFTSE